MDTRVEILAMVGDGVVRLFVPLSVWRVLLAAARVERMDRQLDVLFATREAITDQVATNIGIDAGCWDSKRPLTAAEARSADAQCDDNFWRGLGGGSGGSL